MPEFGFGIGDLLLFGAPFAILFLAKRVGLVRFSAGAGGAVAVGVLCLVAQRVNLRFGGVYTGKAATAVGVVYIVGGLVFLWLEFANRTNRDDDSEGTSECSEKR